MPGQPKAPVPQEDKSRDSRGVGGVVNQGGLKISKEVDSSTPAEANAGTAMVSSAYGNHTKASTLESPNSVMDIK